MVTIMDDRQRMLDAETRLFSAYFGGAAEDRRPGQYALLAAILIHIVLLYATFPRFSVKEPRMAPAGSVRLTIWRPPPPPQREPLRPVTERKLKTRKLPLPDPTPDEPEPITEPEPDPVPEPLPADAFAVIGRPDPLPVPGAGGPRTPGVAGVSYPERIVYVEPVYPQLARKAGIEGVVHVRAIITQNGDVASVTPISCTAPNVGFEDAAMAAVKQWRYKPGKQNGEPVDIDFTITVTFTIQ